MNLLAINNRQLSIEETNGYIKALTDINEYLKILTNFDPRNRMVDACSILDSMADTGAEITKQCHQRMADIILNSIL